MRHGRVIVRVGTSLREGLAHVAITPGVMSVQGAFYRAGYTHSEPVPGEGTASARVDFAHRLADRYLHDSRVPIVFQLPVEAAKREKARARIPDPHLVYERARALTPAQARALTVIVRGGIVRRADTGGIDNLPGSRVTAPTYLALHTAGLVVEDIDTPLRTGHLLRPTPAGEQINAHLTGQSTPAPTQAATGRSTIPAPMPDTTRPVVGHTATVAAPTSKRHR